jgi:hypothetical protein
MNFGMTSALLNGGDVQTRFGVRLSGTPVGESNMPVKIFYTLMLVLALALGTFASIRAADGEKPRGGPGRMPQLLLDHADELGLTADQKAKLQDMAKGPMSVLTDEQKTKAKDLLPKGPGGDKKGKKDAPAGDAPKKPEDKPAEKKPDTEEKK